MLLAVAMLTTSSGVVRWVIKLIYGLLGFIVTPSPSWLLPLLPQHFTLPSVSRAHEWEEPKEMLVAVVMFDTSTGVELEVVVPSPSLPRSLEPQHFTLPSVSRTHEWEGPKEMLVTAPSTLSDNTVRSTTLNTLRRSIVVDRRFVRSIRPLGW